MRTNLPSKRRALVIVDLQKDFCPGGALPAASGNDIVHVINQILPQFDFVIASKDWHPQQTVHFETWPPHCIRGTAGANLHEELHTEAIDQLALKGTGNTDDGYSAFEATNLDMEFELKKRGVEGIFITGIATEYCVKATAMDALKSGFKVYLVEEGVAAVEKEKGDHEKAIREMKEAGCIAVKAKEI